MQDNSGYILLACEIILDAIKDYNKLVKRGAQKMYIDGKCVSRSEILTFFRSDWGEFLCSSLGLDNEQIIKQLVSGESAINLSVKSSISEYNKILRGD